MPRLIDADNLLMDNSWDFYDENGNRNDACIAVENAPTVDAVPIEWINRWVNNYCDWNQEKLIECLLRTWRKEPESVRHGHWEHLYGGQYKCSNCGAWWGSEYADEIINDFYYCPNCGAKMDKEGS